MEKIKKRIRVNRTDNKSFDYVLFKRLDKYLHETQCYKNCHLERKELTTALLTNETYLFQAVKKVTGMTLQRYINSLRLNKARDILENNYNLNIESIASESGFRTPRTFYRQFRHKYNMSPTEYRNLIVIHDKRI